MGAIKNHTAATVGNKREEAAEQRGLERVDEGTERLHNLLDRYAGDDGFRVEQVANQFVTFVSTLEAHAEGKQTLNLNTNGIPSAQDTTPPGLPGSSNATQVQDSPADTEPSIAEKLGAQLLQLLGNDPIRANQVIQFMGRAVSHDVRYFPYMEQVLDTLTRKSYPDTLVDTPSEGLVLQSQLDLRDAKDELKDAKDMLDRLVEGVTGTVIANETPREAVIRSHKELVTLKKNASQDTIIDAVKITSGIDPKAGETLAGYLSRVITELKSMDTADDSQYFGVVKHAAKIDPNTGESFKDYFARAWTKLQTEATSKKGASALLDEIGQMLKLERNGMEDPAFKDSIMAAIERHYNNSKLVQDVHKKLKEIADANGIIVDNNEGTWSLAKKLIAYKRRPGSGIKGI